ncbi:hypothetical protein PHSY_002859 [Pseudozyma hubeiensis SY62]|uniref:Uncharacterized protein n=1 Tax=Pseudozyma hubeiensis (strain SY62) TaxID=1305764 RepID=R9P225_PSEHS|nr:hypothetical protein PHSY_002859 [Pseudozyma hubeiensis SY62]GAC95284.1 hypothetical protein PHSY_002859 [Pseudozyma hubeiensis SY62]
MQFAHLLSVLSLTLTLSHLAVATAIPPTSSGSDSKFVKRGNHVHYHNGGSSSGGGGMFGNSKGSMAKTIIGGTALAGGAGFAATAGSIGAHRLFDQKDDDQEGGGRKGGAQQGQTGAAGWQQQMPGQDQVQVYPKGDNRALGAGTGGERMRKLVVPVALLMSDGSYRALSEEQQYELEGGERGMQEEQQEPPRYSPQMGGAGQGQPGAAGGGGFVFPDQGAK